MRHNVLTTIFSFFLVGMLWAQDKTTVRANSSDISDNLDLRAVATIFGDASDLEDFERRLNDPKSQISNLDLNNDNFVDYLRVIESIEGNAHLIIIQAVLDKDIYQDVATVEVEKDRNNNIQVQVVGDVYMYGENYIYEPVYVHRPVIYTTFWVTNYRPYCSSWYWNYYPTYYTCWRPFPIFRYRNHIAIHINFGHTYHYVTTRRCHYAYNNYYSRRCNGYERRYPNHSFAYRNRGYSNRHELDQNRNIRTRVNGSRELVSNNRRNEIRNQSINPRSSYNSPRNNTQINTSPRNNQQNTTGPRYNNTPRNNSIGNSQNSSGPRYNNQSSNPRTNQSPRNISPRNNGSYGQNNNPRNQMSSGPRENTPRTMQSSPRNNGNRNFSSGGNNRGNNNNSNTGRTQGRSGRA